MLFVGMVGLLSMAGCNGCEDMDDSYIDEFHEAYFGKSTDIIKTQQVALYVDYSKCISQAMNDGSCFFKNMVEILVGGNIKDYYSIKGTTIAKEEGDKYELLKSIEKKGEQYADIKKAAETIANGDVEGILLTDGELYKKTIAKGHDNDPWMESAITKWLSRGHEIYIFAEPYKEHSDNNKKVYDKKRYYFIFTDTRFEGNIYDQIKSIPLKKYPNVETYHLTANHFDLYKPGSNNSSVPNENLNCKPVHCTGKYEVQIWDQLSWKDIYKYIATATDDMGNTLPNGEAVITGLNLDKNSGGSCFRITDVDVRISNISEDYQNFCMEVESGSKPRQIAKQNPITLKYADHFITIDREEFKNHGNLDVYFDGQEFDPSLLYNTKCGNLLKIDFVVKNYQNNFNNKEEAESIFTFPSITKPGEKNVSVAASIRNAISNPSVKNQIKNRVIYTIYIFSGKNNL